MTRKRIVIASGGTGGHFYPGFALAQELRGRGWQVLFLVKKADLAIPALEEADFPYAELDVVSLPRSANPLKLAAFGLKLAGALALARRVMSDFRPDAALGTGSYVGFPALAAARLAGVPVFIHESNARLGLGNRLAGTFCAKAALGLPLEDNPFPGKTVLTGTPIRSSFAAVPASEEARKSLGLAAGKFTVLVFGGSQGAARLNSAVVAAFKTLKADFQAVHITGRKNYREVLAAYETAGVETGGDIRVFDYREDMPLLYSASDVVISRSGASTISELAQLRKPAILVPLPASAGGHQKANALALAGPGAAVCVEEGPGFEERLANALSELPGGRRLVEMSANFDKTSVPPALGAADALARLIEGAAAPGK